MVSILNIIQVKQLCDIGVSALRVCSVDCLNEVAKGKYRFGMFFTDFCKQGQLISLFCSIYGTRDLAVASMEKSSLKQSVSG